MTVPEVISTVEHTTPNQMEYRYKVQIVAELENTFREQLLLLTTRVDPKDSAALTIPKPYEDVYALWLESKLHYYNRDYDKYQNAAALFESRWNKLKTYVCRVVKPAYGGTL